MADSQIFHLTVNDMPRQVACLPQKNLMDVIRDDLRLTGTKDGCSTGHCGSCMVIQDGKPVRACLVPMKRAEGATITTIEGVCGADGGLHPIQQAYIDQGATQCGICTPGFVMATKALLDKTPNPTLEEIYDGHAFNICRCTGYNAIIRAIQQAAGQPVPTLPEVKRPMSAISQPKPRPDAVAKVTGKGIYADDIYIEGMLHAKALRSKYPHALIKQIDTSAAKALPGVAAVLTHADVPGRKDSGVHEVDWPVLCYDKVRYVGDALALVLAESEDVAEQALSLIAVEYEVLPVVTDPKQAAQADAPILHAQHKTGNFKAEYTLENGDVAQGFAESDVVIEREYSTQFVEHGFIEPEAGVAVPGPDGRITVYCGGQIPFGDRAQIAATLDVPESMIRVVNCLIGGGFGGKEDVSVQILAALAAQHTQRPVKLVFSRKESLLFHPKRHATQIRMKTGAKRDGTLVAHEVEIYGDGGAYASLSNHVMLRATTHAAGPNSVPNAKVTTHAMYTNNVPCGAFRGFGVTQSTFAMESQLDELAKELGITPLEIRRKNILAVGKKTLAGHELMESVGLGECLDLISQEIDKHPFVAVEGDKRRAWGMACAYKNTGFGSGAYDAAGAEVELFANGRASAKAGAAEIGQGLITVMAQIVSEELGVPFENVDVLVADTDHTLDCSATTASRQTYVTGNATRHAAIEVRKLLSQTAAEMLDVAPELLRFADGCVYVTDDERRTTDDSVVVRRPSFVVSSNSVLLADVVKAARREGRIPKISYQYVAPMVPKYHHFAFGFGAQAVLVEVDVKTGETKVLKVVAANDVGRVMNPLALQGQVEGSINMGFGMAIQENFVMKDGYVVTDTLKKVNLPTMDQTPEIISFFVEHETKDGPYGAKGVGELASIPTTPATINAIYNATGVRCYNLPADKKWLREQLAKKS